MAISDKLNYLIETKQLFKDRLNSLGAEITSSTTFRNYLTWLDTFYGEVSDKTDLSKNGVVGRTSQESTTGKNLLYISSQYDYGQNGVNGSYNENDGSFTITGTAIASGNSQVTRTIPLVLEAGTYTFSLDHTISKQIYLHFNYAGGSTQNILIPAGQTEATDTLTANTTGYNIRFAVINGNTYNEKVYMQLESGSIATDWEEYTGGQPSPNPDYPQPINNLSGDVAYKVSGKNLFDKTKDIVNGKTYNSSGDIVNLQNVSVQTEYISVNKNSSYTLSSDSAYSDVENHRLMIVEYDTNKNFIKRNLYYYNERYLTITTDINTSYVRLGFTSVAIDKLQFERNDEPTILEPYIAPRTFTIPLKSKNIVPTNISNWESGQYNNNGYKQDMVSRIRLKELLPIKPNTTYYFDTFDTTEFSLIHNYIVRECDINGNFINSIGIVNNQSTYTSNNNAYYLMVTIGTSSTQSGEIFEDYQTYFNEGKLKPFICLNSEIDKSYEPYYDIELCEIDTNKDKIYSSNGKFYLEKNCGSNIFDNDITVNAVNNTASSASSISLNGTYSIIKSTLNTNIKNNTMYCSIAKYEYNSIITDNLKAQTNLNDNTMCMRQGLNDRIYFKNSIFTGKTGFEIKEFIEGEKLYYLLNTPTTTEITQENYPSLYNALKQIQDYLTAYKINKEFILGYSSPEIEY